MKISPAWMGQRTINNLFGMLIAVAFVWGLYDFNKTPSVPEISVPEVVAQRASAKAPVIVDVRGPQAHGNGHIDGALHIPLDDLQARARELPIDKAAPVVVYCGNGSNLGPLGTAKLQSMGYTNVANLSGGIEGWRAAGQKVAVSKG
jgi:rhodanese-related sulfurtransferase